MIGQMGRFFSIQGDTLHREAATSQWTLHKIPPSITLLEFS
ncbi:MAG: hypothetical protein ACPGVG_05000 [Mycobacterium sp.]